MMRDATTCHGCRPENSHSYCIDLQVLGCGKILGKQVSTAVLVIWINTAVIDFWPPQSISKRANHVRHVQCTSCPMHVQSSLTSSFHSYKCACAMHVLSGINFLNTQSTSQLQLTFMILDSRHYWGNTKFIKALELVFSSPISTWQNALKTYRKWHNTSLCSSLISTGIHDKANIILCVYKG